MLVANRKTIKMRKYKYIIVTTLFLLFAIGISEARYIDGSGVIKREKRNISGAKYLVNESSAKVILSSGQNEEVIVEADDNLINLINTYVKNNKLIISFANVSYRSRYMVIYVTMKDIKGIKSKGSGDIVSKGQIKSDNLTVLVEGSGDVNIANILANAVSVAVFGSGDVRIAGLTDILNAEIVGSGDIAANRLQTKDANVKIVGSGDCIIDTSNQALVQIIGSGDLILYREPKTIKRSIIGSGNIRLY